MKIHIARVALVALLCFGTFANAADEPAQLFSEDAAGILELAGHSRLVVDRIPGKVYLRVGKDGELRYMARSLEHQQEQRPVALWLRGRSMILRPVEGREDEPLLLEIAVSPGVAAKLDLVQSQLSVSGMQSSVEIHASRTDIDVRNLDDDLKLDLEGGGARVDGVLGSLHVEVSDVETTLARIEGPVTVSASESRIELTEALGDVEIDADGGSVTATTVGRMDAFVREGELRLTDARIGAELRLESANLHVADSRGELRVDSDADVTCEGLQGTLIVTGFGSSVRGAKITGPVEVITDNAAVELQEIEGQTRVQGAGLKVGLTQMKGSVRAELSASDLTIDHVTGAVEIKAEFGDVAVYNATGAVKIESLEGNVRVINLSGPLQLKAEGERVDVSWAALAGETNQSVENSRGDLHLWVPANAEGTISASAPAGRIESSVSDVQISDDASSASGSLGGKMRPLVRVRSGGGNVHLAMGQPQAVPATKAKGGKLKLQQPDQ